MFKTKPPTCNRKSFYTAIKETFHSEKGVIDLASIMVGTIVTGLIGGVVASTVFVVIPWTQDNAAKQQLDSIVQAQNAHYGLSSDPSSPLPAGTKTSTFANSAGLNSANLLATDGSYCISTSPDGSGYEAYSKSDSGNFWLVTDKDSTPIKHTGSLPSDCLSLLPPYTDPAPKTTTMTYKCDVDTTGSLPMYSNVTGVETWSDGVTQTYTGASATTPRSFAAGVTYKVNFEGTYRAMNSVLTTNVTNLSPCLRSVDHWGMETGIADASSAFNKAINLTAVPERIPQTIELMPFMFSDARSFNDPNISKWNVSNVRLMKVMFSGATSFNQPLNHWNVSKVTDMNLMFRTASSFNQPLNNWNVSKVTNMYAMFVGANKFNQPLNNWNVSSVTNMQDMFNGATAFNQPLDRWNVGNVTQMQSMFRFSGFNQPIGNWNVSNVTTMHAMFYNASAFNQPLDAWNVSKVTSMFSMFSYSGYNQPLNNWNVSNVTNMSGMFYNASAFNQPLDKWNVSNVIDMQDMFNAATVFNQPLNTWNVSKVNTMRNMFSNASAFNQPLNNWNTGLVTRTDFMFSAAAAFNQDISMWNTSSVTNMNSMFERATVFNQNISGWSLASNPSGVNFRAGSALTASNSPFGV